jgi:hypothetical protein
MPRRIALPVNARADGPVPPGQDILPGHGVEMRSIAVLGATLGVILGVILGAICALSQAAAAQTGECGSITDPAALLACYNNTTPPAAAARRAPAARPPAAAKPQVSTVPPPVAARPQASNADGSKYVDPIGKEDAIVRAKLRNICRGC